MYFNNSLGLSIEELKKTNERGIRLDAIHLRGVENLSTGDIFHYFHDFAASNVEWIDHESCKWMDNQNHDIKCINFKVCDWLYDV